MENLDVNYVLVQQIERDICLLYHQLAEYGYIMGDLNYGEIYARPYWRFLELEGIGDESRRKFIRDGCLVMILAMCEELMSDAGGYIVPHLMACRRAVARLEPEDEDAVKLVKTVELALDHASQGKRESVELSDLASWVHETYVRGYFRARAE